MLTPNKNYLEIYSKCEKFQIEKKTWFREKETWFSLINLKYLYIYGFSIIQTTRKLKLIKRIDMHLFYSASNIVKMVLLVDLSAIFLASPLLIMAW